MSGRDVRNAINPRPYQQQAVDKALALISAGIQRVLIVLPTGAGKTIVAVLWAMARGGRTLFLVPREEILEQTVAKIRMANPKASIGIVKGGLDERDARFVVASVATISRPDRLARFDPRAFTNIVVDESHHAPAETWRRVLDYFGAFDDDGPAVLGLTATPNRADGIGLGEIFQEIAHELTVLELIEQDHLSDARATQVKIRMDPNKLHVRGGDFIPAEIEQVLRDTNAAAHIAQAYRIAAPDRRGIGFFPTVATAHEGAEALTVAGIPAVAISGQTPTAERRSTLADFRDGRVQVVTNAMVLTEGFDEPRADCIIIARPTKSTALYAQMCGRGLRKHPDKRDCLIMDCVGATERHDLVTATALFGLPTAALNDVRVTVRDYLASLRTAGETTITAPDGTVQTIPVSIFKSDAAWVQREGRYVIGAGEHGLFAVVPFGDTWRVVQLPRDYREAYIEIAAGLDFGYAVGVAEDRAKALGAGRLIDRSASWRTGPPTESQLVFARRLRIPARVLEGKTVGQVSELITLAQADRRLASIV